MQDEKERLRRDLTRKDEEFNLALQNLRDERDQERKNDAAKLQRVEAQLEEHLRMKDRQEKDSVEDKKKLKLALEAKLANNANELLKQRQELELKWS